MIVLDVYLKQTVNPDNLASSLDVAKIVEDSQSSEGTAILPAFWPWQLTKARQ